MTVRGCSNQSKGNRQQGHNRVVIHPINLEMTDIKPISEVRCEDSEQRNISATNPVEEEESTCATKDSKRTWAIPSLQELEELLHSAPRSCRHGDEVWPDLYLGDM